MLTKQLTVLGGAKVIVYTEAPVIATVIDTAGKTKAELLALADDMGLELSSRMTKAQIIEALEASCV